MTTLFAPAVLAIALALASSTARPEEPATAERVGPCRSEGALDGNTALLRCPGGPLRVRLAYLDSPAPGDTGFSEATRALGALLAPRELWLEPAGTPATAEAPLPVNLYDRLGQNLNIALVSLGWAGYRAPDRDDALAFRYEAAEREARAEQRAMWSVWAYTVGRGEEPLERSQR